MAEKQLLGIAGLARSGKSELIRYIAQQYGFVVVGASDIIRRGLEQTTGHVIFTREELRDEGNRLRRSVGADFVIRMGLELPHTRIIFDGIRNRTAQKTLYANGGYMLGLVASPEKRYERGYSAQDDKVQPLSVAAMLEQEAPELNSLDRNGLQLLPVLWNIPADAIIDTTALSLEEMGLQADIILRHYGICPPDELQTEI